ncbi:serine/threonine-protein kinase [Dokdonella sp.]|uniref:serine/threonine-protein kinase n=1 Tax=Dokdonella sp. TaxID=2291710 RepID=UPI002F4159E7
MTTASTRDLFEQALAVPAGRRTAWLDAHCTDAAQRRSLERMLALDESATGAGVLDRPLDDLLGRIAEIERPAETPGTRVGPFVLFDALGEGGSSVVYRAEREQDGVRQTVALKLLRRGLYTADERRRFRDERRALAQLHHPGIAQLIEGGVTEAGVPYIALELVDGLPITDYARENRLDLRHRLDLFVAACRAVDAAHRALIVHRDLKPSNVLVTREGNVKLLDFGIAKLLDPGDDTDATHTGHRAMTPGYAAPEQFTGGAITTATDVYALGVLLGELMTGHRRDRGDLRTPSSRVDAGAAPGTLPTSADRTRRELQGDLDNIVLKATAEEAERRYPSAAALADDVERYLAHQPVSAHPPSPWYRTRKFVARHRGGVLTTAAFLLSTLAALAVALWQAHVARQEAVRANTVRDFAVGVFGAARAQLPRERRPTPEQLVDEAQRRLAASTLDDITRAQVLLTLGEVSLSLSDHARAETQLAQAATLASRGGDPAAARRAHLLHAGALQRAGRNREALQEAEADMAALRARPSRERLLALDVAAASEMALGASARALAHRREAVAVAATLDGTQPEDALLAELALGNALAEAQRYPEAIAQLEPWLARWRQAGFAEDSRYVAALGSLATATDGIGDTARSEARLRELLALERRIYDPPHDAIAATLRDLALIVGRDVARSAEAGDLLDQALAMQRAVFGQDHEEIAKSLDARGAILVEQRRLDEAAAAYREALAVCARAGIKSEVCPRARNNLGMALYRQDRLDEAEAQMRQALAERRALFGDDHPTVAYSLSTLSNVAMKRRDDAQAVEWAEQALAVIDRSGRDASREAVLIRNTCAAALWRAGRGADALVEIERALADWRRVAPEAKPRQVMMLVQKAQILDGLGRHEEARRTAGEGIALGVPADVLSPVTKQLLRTLSGRSDAYPEPATGATK